MYKRGYIIYTHAYVCTNGGIYKVIIGVIFFLLFFLSRISIAEINIFKDIIGRWI